MQELGGGEWVGRVVGEAGLLVPSLLSQILLSELYADPHCQEPAGVLQGDTQVDGPLPVVGGIEIGGNVLPELKR